MKVQTVHERWGKFIEETVEKYGAVQNDVMLMLEEERESLIKDGFCKNTSKGRVDALATALDHAEDWRSNNLNGFGISPALIARHRRTYIYFCLLNPKN